MTHSKLSNKWMVLALFAALAILAAACSPTAAPLTTGSNVELSGIVQTLDVQSWTVDGQQLAVTSQSEIRDAIKVGDAVRIQATLAEDGSLSLRQAELASGPGDQSVNMNDNSNANGDDHNGNFNDNANDNGDDHNGNLNDNSNANGDDHNGNFNDNANDNSNANDNGNSNGNDDHGGNSNDDGERHNGNQNDNGSHDD